MVRVSSLLLACAAAAVHAAAPPMPNWGGNASQYWFSARVNMTDVADSPDHPHWWFNYVWDWTLRADRYDHEAGQYDEACVGFNDHPLGEPCTIINDAVAGAAYFLWPGIKDLDLGCCVCQSSFAPFTMLPDWLARSNTSYMGQSMINGQRVDEWLATTTMDNHWFASADNQQRAVRFMEHKSAGGRPKALKQWDFQAWSDAKPDPDVFKPPPGCTNPCKGVMCA